MSDNETGAVVPAVAVQAQAQAQAQELKGKRANWTIAHKIETVKGVDGQDDARVITWTVKGAGTLKLMMGALSEANRQRAAEHGMVQRISDAAAMARDSKTGASATPQEKFEAMKRLCDHYESGSVEWSPMRVQGGGGARGPGVGVVLLIEALKLHQPAKDAETIEKFVKGLTAAQVSALLLSEQLKEAVELAREAQREKERVQSQGVDAEELLKGL